jgi:uncharacterized protein (DUF2141 family)
MMKFLVTVACLVFASTACLAQLEITIKNIKSDKGNLRAGIFKEKETFLKNATYGKVVKAHKNELKIIFDDLPPGTYAISVIHDENENGKLDSNMIGIPKEGFGFANDAMGTFGPPAFEKASITVETQKVSITITMKYL